MKIWMAVLFISVLGLGTHAQTRIALSAGYNYNSARIHRNNQLQTTGSKPGFNLGMRVQAEFEPPLYFTGILQYNMRGYTYQVLPDSSMETSMHYIDMAPTLNVNFNTGEQSHITLFAGPLLGIAFKGRQTITRDGQSQNSDMKFSLNGDYGFANFAIHSGAAYHFNRFFIEGAYHLGLSSINNEEEFDRTNIKHRGFSINLGFWIR